METKNCKQCGGVIYRKDSRGYKISLVNWRRRKFCGITCSRIYCKNHLNSGVFKKGENLGNKNRQGLEPWNIGTIGIMKRNSGTFTSERVKNEKHPLWKGPKVSKGPLHAWLTSNYGKPVQCQSCRGVPKRIAWANKNGNYVRERAEWLHLCPRCHVNYDRSIHGRIGVVTRMAVVSLLP